jgi:hypothetical protein
VERIVLLGPGTAGLQFPNLILGGDGDECERGKGKGKIREPIEEGDREEGSQKFKIGRKRQVIGILVS